MKAARSLVLAFVVVLGACSTSTQHPVTHEMRCCNGTTIALGDLAGRLKPQCPNDIGNVRLNLTQSRLEITFPCRAVRHDPNAVEVQAVAAVAHRNNAARRAATIVTYLKRLDVFGDRVNGKVEYPFDLATTTFELGTGTGESFGCQRASDLAFRSNEIRQAKTQNHETPTHWLKIEAAYIAGACPDRLPSLYATVRRAGQPDAVTTVQKLLPSASR